MNEVCEDAVERPAGKVWNESFHERSILASGMLSRKWQLPNRPKGAWEVTNDKKEGTASSL